MGFYTMHSAYRDDKKSSMFANSCPDIFNENFNWNITWYWTIFFRGINVYHYSQRANKRNKVIKGTKWYSWNLICLIQLILWKMHLTSRRNKPAWFLFSEVSVAVFSNALKSCCIKILSTFYIPIACNTLKDLP